MKTSESHIPSLFTTIIFVFGALLLFLVALLMIVSVGMSLSRHTGIKAEQTIFLVAFSFEGLILLAAAFFALQKFLQKPAADRDLSISVPFWLIAILVILAAAAILIGYPVSTLRQVNWLLLPVLTIPAVVLPLSVLLAFGIRKLPLGTRSQSWNVLGLAMTIGPLLLFLLEILIIVLIFVIVVVYIALQPELASKMQALSRQMSGLGSNSRAMRELLSPYLTKPIVIVISLIYISVLVPAVEEICKPIGVWIFGGKFQSEAQGFALGALSGAGYALMETVGVSGQTSGWSTLLFSRIGTGLLHVTTSALMGGAIVLAWRERRFLRLFGTYLLAVLLHGLWNAFATLYSFSNLAEVLRQPGLLRTIQPAMIAGMGILAAVLFLILVISNIRLQKAIAPPPPPPQVLPLEATDPGVSPAP